MGLRSGVNEDARLKPGVVKSKLDAIWASALASPNL